MILATRQLLLNLILRTVPAGWTRPAANNSLEWALYSTLPDDNGAGGVECAGGGYAAVAVSAADAAMAIASDEVSNVAAVQFPSGASPLTAGITVAGWVLRTTAGTVLWAQPAAGKPLAVVADGATDTFTRTSHGLADQQPVRFVSPDGIIPLPTNIAADTTYYVRDSAANTFKVAATLGGAAIDIGYGTAMVRKYFGGTFAINERAVIPAGEFRMQLPAPVR